MGASIWSFSFLHFVKILEEVVRFNFCVGVLISVLQSLEMAASKVIRIVDIKESCEIPGDLVIVVIF